MENFNYNLNTFFSNQLENLKCDYDTRAYIVSVLDRFKTISADYSKESLTVLYAEAKFKQDFYTFQNIGDWLFFCNTLFPEHLNNASQDYYYSMGRLSYYSCYKLIDRQWKLYEKMADEFVYLSHSTRHIIRKY
jgi:hypothetical protein